MFEEDPELEPEIQYPAILELIQYTETDFLRHDNLKLEQLLDKVGPSYVNWINVDGIQDASGVVGELGKHFKMHSLLVDDILTDHQVKTEEYDDHLFFTMKMLHSISGTQIDYEQISFVLGKDYLLSFQQKEGDLFDSLRTRLAKPGSKLRAMKADYLMYRLIDVIADSYFKVLDTIGHRVEDLEELVHTHAGPDTFDNIQAVNKELIYLRKALYPLRDALSKLIKDENEFIESQTLRYFRDVYDHVVHLLDSLDTYKDLVSGLMDIHYNTMNSRMNEVMKVLAVISTIFMPLTFIVGIYGMNFDNMPEIHTAWGYPLIMGLMLVLVVGMILFFRYKRWF